MYPISGDRYGPGGSIQGGRIDRLNRLIELAITERPLCLDAHRCRFAKLDVRGAEVPRCGEGEAALYRLMTCDYSDAVVISANDPDIPARKMTLAQIKGPAGQGVGTAVRRDVGALDHERIRGGPSTRGRMNEKKQPADKKVKAVRQRASKNLGLVGCTVGVAFGSADDAGAGSSRQRSAQRQAATSTRRRGRIRSGGLLVSLITNNWPLQHVSPGRKAGGNTP